MSPRQLLLWLFVLPVASLACSLTPAATPTASPLATDDQTAIRRSTAPTRTPVGASAQLPVAATDPVPENTSNTTTTTNPDGECSAPPGWTTYTVQSGDNLYRIAQDHDTDTATLQQANCLDDPRYIEVDQVLAVPGGRGSGGSSVVLEQPGPVVTTSSDRVLDAPETVILYLALSESDGRSTGIEVGCGSLLIPVTESVFGAGQPAARVQAALEALFARPVQPAEGIINPLNSSTLAVQNVSINDGVATVALTGSVMPAGACEIPVITGQIRQTVLADAAVNEVLVTINGQTMDAVFSQR